MLIQFNFDNYRSFRDCASLDFTATRFTEHPQHVIRIGKERILPVAAVFGANASGKSNLLNALACMVEYVLGSFDIVPLKGPLRSESPFRSMKRVPFMLDSVSAGRESLFEVYFTIPADTKSRVWNYGFAVDHRGVQEEWLNVRAKSSRDSKVVFYRNTPQNQLDLDGIPRKHKNGLKTALTNTALLVSLGAKLNVDILKTVYTWFGACCSADFSEALDNIVLSTALPHGFATEKSVQKDVVEFLATFDPSISGFKVDITKDGDRELLALDAVHATPDGPVQLPFGEEAAGTKKMLALYDLLKRTLELGGVLIIDEMNEKLHPLLVRNLLSLFTDPKRNPHNAQLLFATHDAWLLEANILRRDEMWFVDKNTTGESTLYSLAEFSTARGDKVRKDASYAKQYLLGNFGAVPDLKLMDPLGTV